MNAIEAFVPPEVVKAIAAFLEFCYIVRRNIITDDSLDQLNIALAKFHEYRQVFSGTARPEGPSAFSLPRQHSMVHYYDHIKNFGSPNGLCSSITESKHITAVKRPWRRSNKHAALPQMLKVNERLDKIAAARTDFTARGMLVDSCLVQAIKDAFSEDPMDQDACDSDGSGSEVSDNEVEVTDLDNTHMHRLDNINTTTLDDTNEEEINDTDEYNDDYPCTPRQPSPAPLDDEDEDCGPAESGPLMNEVRLVGRKG
jgi:hypothetical protein